MILTDFSINTENKMQLYPAQNEVNLRSSLTLKYDWNPQKYLHNGIYRFRFH